MSLRRHVLEGGGRSVGWKVAFGSSEGMRQLSLAAPLIGFLTDQSLVPEGVPVSIQGWVKPLLELEIAAHMGADLKEVTDSRAVHSAIGGLGLAVELVDLSFPPEDIEAILAGNAYHRAVILANERGIRAGASVTNLSARIHLNGAVVGETDDPEASTGPIVDVIAHVCEELARRGQTLRRGEIVICGAIFPPLSVNAGDTVEASIDPLGRVVVALT
jgi:2-keto-4-pentenoate hydratase